MCFNFLRKKNYVHKISFRNSTLNKFHIKIYLESFISIYHLYHLFAIINTGIFYNLKITLNYSTGSSVKPSISGLTLFENAPWVPGIPVVWHIFSFFSVMTIFELISCIFVLKWFICSNHLLPLPFLLCYYIRWYIQMGKSWSDE